MKLNAILIAIAISSMIVCSCSSDKNGDKPLSADEAAAMTDSAAKADAEAIIKAPYNSASQERAILDFSSKYSRLKASGHDDEATKYAETVFDMLDDSLGEAASQFRASIKEE